jgi:competence protein ComGC
LHRDEVALEPVTVRAFTVLEVLTVISIVSLLAAILMPVLALAKRSALRTNCLANLHSIGIAFSLYGVDDDDLYPAAIDRYTRDHPSFMPAQFMSDVNSAPDLIDVLSVYSSKKSGIWRCPADLETYESTVEEVNTGVVYPSYYAYAGTSYAFWPAWYFAQSQTNFPERAKSLARDMNIWHCEYPDPDIYMKSLNALFPDGHVLFTSTLGVNNG